MASKDKPGSEKKKHNPHHQEDIEARREDRREKKHTLKIIRRRSHRTGKSPVSPSEQAVHG